MSNLLAGKTAAKLLLKAAGRDSGLVSVAYVAPPHGGRPQGARECAAADASVHVGLLELVGRDRRKHYRRGWATNVTETTYRITAAGRAALAGRAS